MINAASLLSPKAFAEAIGVSESSVKRWADSGLIDVTRTAGGHRRIVLSDAIRFVRSRHMRLVHPERIGLTGLDDEDLSSAGSRELEGTKLVDSIMAGRPDSMTATLVAAFVQGMSMADLWDGPICTALESLGELWRTDDSGIPLEHEATMAIMDAVVRIRGLMPDPSPESLTALGGAPSGDPYLLPSLAASAVLTESGFKVVNLGPDTPSASFLDAVGRHEPDLVWLSLTSKRNGKDVAEVEKLVQEINKSVGQVVLGGQFAVANRLRWTTGARLLQTMNNLSLVADTLNANK